MERFKLRVSPVADKRAVVKFGNARFTVLKDRLIRCEYSRDLEFEDAPTQHFWFRQQPVIPYYVRITGEIIEIKTKKLILTYLDTEEGFSPEALSIVLRETGKTWRFGDLDTENLFGTARTLDNCNGDFDVLHLHKLKLSEGLLSRSGWSAIDDSRSLIFDRNGFLSPWRNRNSDIYFFGYGTDYKACLLAYYAISGNVRMIPKWSLGIWWSRWERYTQADLERIAGEFEKYGVPLSVCVIDKDWHLPGWTGYTWNPEFFPDPKGFFKRLHAKKIHACLNLHPANGVSAHEKMYPEMARHMGLDPASRQTIPFDLSDRKFIEGYFKFLHHPLEKDGVDFWWIDWQQGTKTSVTNLDPLWYLNHLHSNDLARDGIKRPINFSRWGNNGSHRYPIGFSGDTIPTWKTLKFQLYFTATSSNIGYSWWSHDIGGFAQHWHNDELYTRWVQFGCFSPIFRFHSSGDPRIDNRPWTKPEEYKEVAISALKLRRALLPYLYTATWENRSGGLPLIRPMYYEDPNDENAYACPNQYYFGEQLVVAPFDQPIDPLTGFSRKAVWLPPGTFYSFFDGKTYEGGRWHACYGVLNDIPVFARAGAVISMKTKDRSLDFVLFKGKGTCDFYDDDGETLGYKKGKYLFAICKNNWRKKEIIFELEKKSGTSHKTLKINLVIRGIRTNELKKVQVNGRKYLKFTGRPDENGDFKISGLCFSGKTLKVRAVFCENFNTNARFTLEDFVKTIKTFKMPEFERLPLLENPRLYFGTPENIKKAEQNLDPAHLKVLFERGCDVGFHTELLYDGREVAVWWNEKKLRGFEIKVSGAAADRRNSKQSGKEGGIPVFIKKRNIFNGWGAYIDYFNAASTEIDRYIFER